MSSGDKYYDITDIAYMILIEGTMRWLWNDYEMTVRCMWDDCKIIMGWLYYVKSSWDEVLIKANCKCK